jgi:hypothetical protein
MRRWYWNFCNAILLAMASSRVAFGQAVTLQGTTPGTPQAGHTNITGTAIAGTLTGKHLDKGGQVFNVKAYGAKGDDFTDDTAAIQSAITACQVAFGGIVFFPSGTYRTTGIVVTSEKVALQGTPQSQIMGTSANQWVIQFDASNIPPPPHPPLAFRNQLTTLIMGHVNQSQTPSVGAVRLLNQSHFLINDVSIYGSAELSAMPYSGFYLENARNGTVTNSFVGPVLGNGVTIARSGNVNLSNVFVGSAGLSGFVIDAVDGLWANNLHAYQNSGFGFYIYDSITTDSFPNQNQFFTASDGDTSGLNNWLITSVRRLTLDHCWAGSNIDIDQGTWASGFYFAGTINGGRSSVTDVVMTGCWAVWNNKNGIEIADAQNLSVVNCEVLGNARSGADDGIVLRGQSSNIRLIGNRCRDDHAEAIPAFPATQQAGISVRDASDSVLAINNDVQGNILPVGIVDLALPSTKRVYRGNLGYNPLVTVPQPAVAATGVAVSNTTNVDCTVFL